MLFFMTVLYDPNFAQLVQLDSGDVKTIDFNLKRIDDNNLSISGQIIDSTNGNNVDKGIIIVQTGLMFQYQRFDIIKWHSIL